VALAGRSSKPTRIVADAAHVDLPSLPEVPRHLLARIHAQRHGHFLTSRGLVCCRGLSQMYPDEQAELPFRQCAQQLGVSMNPGSRPVPLE
jgi:hypothetical protein